MIPKYPDSLQIPNEGLESAEKRPMTNAERAALKRERDRQKQNGTYLPSQLEQAKDILSKMEEPDINKLQEDTAFYQKLTEEDISKLKTFIKNLKANAKRCKALQSQIEMQEIMIKDRVKKITNQQGSELRKVLLTAQNAEERSAKILEMILDNKYFILDYMEDNEPPTQDFLKIIIGLKKGLDPKTFTQLFVRLCGLYKAEDLEISTDMAKDAMEYLTECGDNTNASLGLLGLIYHNNIALTDFKEDLLIRFQGLYQHTISNFFKTLPLLKQHLIEQLPATPFCFTLPMLRCLKEGGVVLHKQMPYQYLPYVVEIICYSFTDSQESFDNFLRVIKENCSDLFESLRTSDFQSLLMALVAATKQRLDGFFRSLNQASIVLVRAFELLREKKIAKFNQETIQNLVNGNLEFLTAMRSRPSILKIGPSDQLPLMAHDILSQIDELSILDLQLDVSLSKDTLQPFTKLSINQLLPIQEMAFRICLYGDNHPKLAFQYPTGQGKTSVCFALGVSFARRGKAVILLNESEELTFRDYKNALEVSEGLGIEIMLLTQDSKSFLSTGSLCYCSTSTLLSLMVNENFSQLDKSVAIVDEFDSFIFERDARIARKMNLVLRTEKLIMFSGSEFQKHHRRFLNDFLKCSFVDLSMESVLKTAPTIDRIQVFTSVKEQRDAILKLVEERTLKTPVIIIQKRPCETLIGQIRKLKIRVENLGACEATQVSATMKTFTVSHSLRYPVFAISQVQGRGIDFPTNSDIERNGGVYVIIGSLPAYFLELKQYIGRTGRIGNKGSYSVLLHDRDSKNNDGEVYFNKKMQELNDSDILFVETQSQMLKLHQQQIIQQPDELATNDVVLEKTQNQSGTDNNISVNDHASSQEILLSQQILALSTEPKDSIVIQSKANSPLEEIKRLPANDTEGKRTQKQNSKTLLRERRSMIKDSTVKDSIDRRYFDNYGKNEIHEEMLGDQIRIEAYRAAITLLAPGKIVVDVGAGTGILSVMAAQAGAVKVFAIERSDIVKQCSKVIKTQNLCHIVKVQNILAEDAPLEKESADIIVSEWMGYFLLYERMLPSVLNVRNKCLKVGGTIIPGRVKLILAASSHKPEGEDQEFIVTDKSTPWEPLVIDINPQSILSDPCCILDLDRLLAETEFDSFTAEFTLCANQTGVCRGFVGWFEAEMTPGVWFSTSPHHSSTHWHQTFFPISERFGVERGTYISGSFQCFPHPENYRGLQITIELRTLMGVEAFEQVFSWE